MNRNWMKRTLSLLLALVLLVGNVPVAAFATEEVAEETVAETVAETAAPTEVATEPAKETTAATEAAVETSAPTAAPTEAPTEPATEPAAEETIAPTLPAVPEETVAPTEPVVEETVVPTEPVEETIPIETAAPTEAVTEPIEETVPATESIEETEAVPETQPMPEVEHVKIPFTVNPLYEGVFTEADFPARAEPASESGEDDDHSDMDYWQDQELLNAPTYLSIEKATAKLKQYLLQRDTSFTLYFKADSTKYEKYLSNMLLDAFKHTGKPKEGDYLQWHFAGWGGSIDYSWKDGKYCFTFKAEVYYLTTGAQEEKLDTAVTKLLKSLNVSDKSNYKKIKAVYDYICQNVTYDYDHLEDDSYVLKHSAYAALVKKTAVCQGYATLLYRILLELDVDVRVIAGLAEDGSGHAWNIVRIGDVYYNLDATWDAGYDEYYYFLRNSINFPYHYRNMEYATTQFHTDYPMAQEDYVEGVPGVSEQYIAIGLCGDEVAFAIDRERNLVIAGNGPMWDFTSISDSNKDNCPPWYYWMDAFEHVVIEEGVTTIGQRAFQSMTNITSVTLPDTLVEIGDLAFWSLSKLETIVLPPALETIGNRAFERCKKLTEIAIPDSVKSLGTEAFYTCSALTKISIGVGLKAISDHAFRACSALADVTLSEGLESIGSYSFGSCESLSEIDLPESLTVIDVRAFTRCGLVEIDFPDNITEIKGAAFERCVKLTSVSLPENLVSLGDNAFAQCSSLQKVHLPDGVTKVGAQTFRQCGALTDIKLSKSLQSIGDRALEQCSSLTDVDLPESLTSIGDYAFSQSGIIGIIIPNGVRKIGVQSFSRCDALEYVILTEGLTSIGEYAFWDCENLKTVNLPNSLTRIDNLAFASCSSLSNIVIPVGITTFGQNIFGACVNLTNVVLSEGITEIANGMFFSCTSLREILLPSTLESIPYQAFGNCKSLEYITVPASVSAIGGSAFVDCAALKRITFEGDAPTLNTDSFRNVIADAYYTAGNKTWTEDVLQNYGGTITWIARCLEHEYSSVEVVAPACTENGYTIHTCPVCGDSYHTDETEMLGHDLTEWEIVRVETCTEDGSKIRSCQREGCGHSETEVIPALGHDMGAWIIDKEAICEEDGQQHRACSRCDHIETEAISAFGHSYESVVTPPTYTKDGYTTHTCTACGDTYTDAHVDAPGLSKPAVEFADEPVTGGGTLIWEAVPEADYYEIYRATSKSGKYKLLETVEGTELEVKVSVGKTYYYKVKAICEADSDLNSGYSSVVKVTGKCAQPDVTVAVSESSGKPVLKWGKVTSAKKYTVYRATAEDGTYKKVKTTTSRSYTDSSAKVGVTYFYKVKAVASKSTYSSAYSEIKSCLTVCARPSVTLKIASATGKPAISWKAISGAVQYEILRAESADGEFTKLAVQSTVTYTDLSAAPDKDYWYKVNALGATAELNSADGTAKKIHATLAKPMVTFAVDEVSGKPVLTWEAVEGAVQYKIYRSTSAKKSYKAIATVTDTEYVATSASVGKGYYYKVIAIGETAKSDYSSYKKLTAKCAQPVITVEASETSGKPVIKWSKVSGAKKYYVYRVDETGARTSIGSTTKTYFTDSKAVLGTTYTYQVRAIGTKSAYNSIYSESVDLLVPAQ